MNLLAIGSVNHRISQGKVSEFEHNGVELGGGGGCRCGHVSENKRDFSGINNYREPSTPSDTHPMNSYDIAVYT